MVGLIIDAMSRYLILILVLSYYMIIIIKKISSLENINEELL